MYDFPTAPPVGTVVTLPDGTQRVWDGVKWHSNAPTPGSGADGTTGPLTVNGALVVNSGGDVVDIHSNDWYPGVVFDIDNTLYGQLFRTNRNGKARWLMELGNDTHESGGNSGTDFVLLNCDDAGNQLGTPVSIRRSDGQIALTGSLNITSSLTSITQTGSSAVHIHSLNWYAGITFEVDNTTYGQYFRTNRNGVPRWIMELGTADAESGTATGTDFNIQNFDNAGNPLGTPLSIRRSDGTVTLGAPLLLAQNAVQPLEAVPFQQLTGLTSGYLTMASASATYLTQANASTIYETKSHASATYLTTATASATYETQAHATATYVSQAYVNANFLNLAGGNLNGALGVAGPVTAEAVDATHAAFSATTPNPAVPLQNFYFLNTGNLRGSITTDGTNTYYNTTSDATLKIDDGPIDGDRPGGMIDALEPKWFRWQAREDDHPEPGFFAQQVAPVYPWAVTKGQGTRGQQNYRPWQMDAGKLMPVVIAELQALRARVKQLEEAR